MTMLGGNGNALMDYGESILLSLALENIGNKDAESVNVEFSTSDPYITFADVEFEFCQYPSRSISIG